MATASIILDKRRADKNKFYPLKIRIVHKNKNVAISTGVNVPAESWVLGKNGMEINRKFPDAKTLNLELSSVLIKIRQGIKELEESGKLDGMTASQIKEYVLKRHNRQPEEITFTSYFKKFAEARNALRTRELYLNTLQKIVRWSNNYVMFEDITYSWLNEFRNHLKAKGNKTNTIAIDERNIRAVVKSAIDEEVTEIKDPFRKYKIKQQHESNTMPLTIEQIKSIRDFQTNSESLQYARDVFMCSFYLTGINISDLYDLKKDTRARYHRHKTGIFVDIEIQPEVKQLSDKYFDNDRMFNFYKRYTNHYSFTSRINKYLKTIGKSIGIPNLIMYHARHTWATQSAISGAEEKTIAKALGHSYRTTTSRYARFDFRKVDELNRTILDLLL